MNIKIKYLMLITLLTCTGLFITNCGSDASSGDTDTESVTNDSENSNDTDSSSTTFPQASIDVSSSQECSDLVAFLEETCNFNAGSQINAAGICLVIDESASDEIMPAFSKCIEAQECSTWETEQTTNDTIRACIIDATKDAEPSESTQELLETTCTFYATCNDSVTENLCESALKLSGYDALVHAIEDEQAATLTECIPKEPACDGTETETTQECLGSFSYLIPGI